MVGQAEVVVRAQQQYGAAVQQNARALWPGDAAQLAVQAALPDLLQALFDLVHAQAASDPRDPSPSGVLGARLGPPSLRPCVLGMLGSRASIWTTSGNVLGEPSGRGGTEVFLRWRSWTAGFQKLASSCESISSSTGVRGVSPSSHPERLSGRGLEPLSGWRATFRPNSSNIALSSAGSTPRVVRKFPIITPLRPALTATGARSWRFSTRPPQRRKRASGRISRKIATHLTTSQGSISSRPPNLVPARGLSRLIGTECGLISESSKAISTRCRGVSPRLRIPPTHVSRPASLTASIVRSLPS